MSLNRTGAVARRLAHVAGMLTLIALGSVSFISSASADAPGVPRYQVYAPPADSAANNTQGEFNIGFDPKTGRIMTYATADASIFRVTTPELLSPALPEACDASWQDVTPPVMLTPAPVGDPILFTDSPSGRTFASNFTGGATILFSYTDDDGASWTQASAAPPAGSADHQTIGSGPYPASSPFAAAAQAVGFDHAVYYCAQSDFPSFCQRSDDGGATFGPGVPIFDGITSSCLGIHGHVKVAPNGTVWVPVRNCYDGNLVKRPGYAVSTDAGLNWTNAPIPNAAPATWDPSIGIDVSNNAYFCYAGTNGSPHVIISHDGGQSWVDDRDIGASVGIQNAVFPEAVGGDTGRAACGFVGTTTPGAYGALDFTGSWYLYIASTYDGGKTWVTVNATPADPVQGAGGICTQGTACTLNAGANNRNLLDFNEVTLDKQGRVLFGYDDGCVTPSCINSAAHPNDFVADSRIARQIGGKTLRAAYDGVTDTVAAKPPKGACLAGTQTGSGMHLSWRAPDSGGADITGYEIDRGTASGNETVLTQVGATATSYDDSSTNPSSTYSYVVKAINNAGYIGAKSNSVLLASLCTLPGVTVLTDATGDNLPPIPGTDLKTVSVAQPYQADGVSRMVFTIKTDPGQSTQAPGSSWYVSLLNPRDGLVHGVRMVFKAGSLTPSFDSYIASPSGGTAPVTDGRFVQSGTTIPAESASSYDAAGGKITIVVRTSDLNLQAGDAIGGFNAAATQTTDVAESGIGGTSIIDGLPDSLARQGTFQVSGAGFCPGPPISAAVRVSPTSIDFGKQTVRTTSAAQGVTVSNSGALPYNFAGTTVIGDYAVASSTCGSSLGAGASCLLNVTFSPTAAGSRPGRLVVNGTNGSNASVTLAGTGQTAPAVTFNPASLDFGNQKVNVASRSKRVAVTNNGSAPLKITRMAISPWFTMVTHCPATLNMGASCGIDVTFKPTVATSLSGTLAVVSNASTSPDQVPLTGTGVK